MAVKFSAFTPKTTAEASNVTEIVGYLSTGNENIRIVPSAFDTTYAFTTVTDGSNVDLIATATKGTQASTTETIQFTAGTAISLTAGTREITIANTGVTSFNQTAGATSTGTALTVAGTGSGPYTGAVTVAANIYAGGSNIGIVPSGGSAGQYLDGDTGAWTTLPSDVNTTYTVDVPTATTNINLAGSDGSNDAITLSQGTDISLTRISASEIQIASTATGGVSSVDETTPGTSTGDPIVVNPTTGTVLVQSMAYAGGSNVGHVPSGGSAGQYLDGDTGAWITLPSTLSISKQQFTGDNTTTDFTLTTASGCTVDNLAIYISGVYQNKLDASSAANFTVGAGTNPTLAFSPAPPVTAVNGIEVVITR